MDTPLLRRAYNLGLKAVPNFEVLSPEQIEYYEQHLGELQAAIRRGFVLPTREAGVTEFARAAVPPVMAAAPSPLFKASDTDLDYWLAQTEVFARQHLGVRINLRERFAIPAELPWRSVIPVFDPGNLDNRDMVKMLKGLGLDVKEESDVMNYAGSQADKAPTLHLIENLICPNAWTLTTPGTSPDEFRATGKLFIRMRGYGLAFGLRFFVKKDWLDPETVTWFPEDRLPDGYVAYGYWDRDNRKVGFCWYGSGSRLSNRGARVALPVSLRPS
jgi:hypothetical protein